MTISELYELLYLAEGSMDRLFEMWISGTFAVVVACFFAGEKMGRFMFLFVSLLYSFFAANLAIRWLYQGQRFERFFEQLAAEGEAFELSASVLLPILTVGTFLGGTFGAIGFIWYSYKIKVKGT